MESEKSRQIAQAILDHSNDTKQDPKKVLEMLANGMMVVVRWKENQLWLIFDSPNGL